MKRVVIVSPFSGDIELHRAYLRACMRDCFIRGEAPFAGHGLYTQQGVLNDGNERERELGMKAGQAWGARADLCAVYWDLGISKGMQADIETFEALTVTIERRSLGRNWLPR